MPLPKLTSLQFLVLDIVARGDRSGRDIRRHLASQKVKKSGPAFYQLMARMEDAGLVEGRYEQEIIEGQIIRERWYKAKGTGVRALNDTREFYASRDLTGRGLANA